MSKRKFLTVPIAGKDLIFETGKVAPQAGGAVLVRCGDTVVFASACGSPEPAADTDFLPLRVDYTERMSAAGRTLGGFIKREGRPTEKETLVCRLIDRPLRPMFEDGFYNEVQVISYVFSYDGVHSPEPIAICAASAALVLSDIPLIKPVASVRVGLVDNQFVINPTVQQMEKSQLDLVLAGTEDAILMIEGYADFLTEEQVLESISLGHAAIREICVALSKWQQEIGKPKVRDHLRPIPKEVIDAIDEITNPLLEPALRIGEKLKREEALGDIKDTVWKALLPEGQEPKFKSFDVKRGLKEVTSRGMRRMILRDKVRSDGRTTKDIRFIDIEQAIMPRAHGSSLFTRGETQVLAICTLGGESMGQRFEGLLGEGLSRFYLQYSFPPFSVGEVGRMGSPGRREVGHGKLAERSLQAALPSKEEFPYIMRIECNTMGSNGSSSMASVCGGCLAMRDAGVPIKRPVAGIAMGLILEGNQYAILSDILGIEDALGDMDFKVAGDDKGITAFQLDIKVNGITYDIMKDALMQAKEGRLHILNEMLKVSPQPKALPPHAPRIETIKIKPSKIGVVIGPGGKQIRAIEQFGVKIDIDDDGTISISSATAEGVQKAREVIEGLTSEVEIGRIYHGKVTSVVPFGVFVEILPGKEGLCHISQFDRKRIDNLADYVRVGDELSVKVLEINERGQFKLSRRAVLEEAS